MKNLLILILAAGALAGCMPASKTDRQLTAGAAGALTGAIIGGASGSVEKALTGAAIGGAAGAVVGGVTAPKNCVLIDASGREQAVACP